MSTAGFSNIGHYERNRSSKIMPAKITEADDHLLQCVSEEELEEYKRMNMFCDQEIQSKKKTRTTCKSDSLLNLHVNEEIMKEVIVNDFSEKKRNR